jgi:hypothetical protein
LEQHVHHVAEDVELELLGSGVADPHNAIRCSVAYRTACYSLRRAGHRAQETVGAATSRDTAAIASSLASSDAMLREYAAAAAARIAHRDPGPLIQTIESVDPTIKQFAMDMAERADIASK